MELLKKPILLGITLTLAMFSWAQSEETSDIYQLNAPSGKISLSVEQTEKALRLSAKYATKPVIEALDIALQLEDGTVFGAKTEVSDIKHVSNDSWVEPVVKQKAARLHDRYEGIRVDFANEYSLEIRAYDFGFAYRLITSRPGKINVLNERMKVRFPEETRTWFPEEEKMISHNERNYLETDLASLDTSRLASLPLMMNVPGVARILFSEADLYDYPGMYVRGDDGPSIKATFPKYPLEIGPDFWGENPVRISDRSIEITKEADYIARTEGSRPFPWRFFLISNDDSTFLEKDFVFLLSRPLEIDNPDWIQPGKIAWDWYNSLNLTGVDFRTGINNQTYEYYIDFASEYGIEYILLDEGWSYSTRDISRPNPDIDIPHLVEYGKERGVDVILWALWGPIEKEADKLFELYHSWGVKGVKIDFMQHSNQRMVNFYTETAKLAAKHKLLVDYHGSFKPSGLRRAYPNVMTYEGVRGNENNKWSHTVTPEHNVTIPFIRMATGPMDYTPGSMSNINVDDHPILPDRPMSMGTRANEVAKYIVFESALQMLCDTPTNYQRESETTSFIAKIPVTWDETHGLSNEIGKYVSLVRRKGDQWYMGVMNNNEARSLELDLSVLPKGRYKAEVFKDGINAAKHAEDYKLTERIIQSGETIHINLIAGGGWSAVLTPLPEEK